MTIEMKIKRKEQPPKPATVGELVAQAFRALGAAATSKRQPSKGRPGRLGGAAKPCGPCDR